MPADALAVFAAHWGTDDPETAMSRACADLRHRAGQHEVPLALALMCEHAGAVVDYNRSVEGDALQAYGSHWHIRIAATPRKLLGRHTGIPQLSGTWRRARFSLAHELGHILLLEPLCTAQRVQLANASHHRTVEWLCNTAAAELLMPAEPFVALLRRHGFTPTGLRALYDAFLVSWTAVLVRAAVLSRGNLSLWAPAQRAGDAELMRVTNSYGTGHGLWLPRGLSERSLSQPVVRTALRDGDASARRLGSSYEPDSASSPALASYITATPATQQALPVWHGLRVCDERVVRDQVALLRLPETARTTWRELRRSPPIDGAHGSEAPMPLAMPLPG